MVTLQHFSAVHSVTPRLSRSSAVAAVLSARQRCQTHCRRGRELHTQLPARDLRYPTFGGHVAASWRNQQVRQGPSRPARTQSAVCRADVTQSSNTSASSVAVSRYLGRGPYTASQPIKLSFRVGQGRSGALDCSVNVFLPRGGSQAASQRWPLMVLSAGFLLHSGLYESYASDIASWGIAVVLYDLPELVDDVTMVSALGLILDACTTDQRVSPYIDARAVLLAGHSRGGKLSVLTAASDPRVKGIALLDPVDVTAMTPPGPGYPSALPAMRAACGPPRNIPALIVGAACNGGVVPADANYKRFFMSCPGPCWFVELKGTGHLQFLDSRVDLFAALVPAGPTPDQAVREVSKASLVAWALELAVPVARGEVVNGRQVLERLQQTASVLERRASLSWSFKGFEGLGAPAGSSTGRPSAGAAGRSGGASSTSSSSSSRSAPGSSWTGGAGGTSGVQDDTQRASARAAGSAAGSGAASSQAPFRADGGGSKGSSGGGKWSYDELMRKRAKELKAILVERGVDCSDCFEKADLAKRIMERC